MNAPLSLRALAGGDLSEMALSWQQNNYHAELPDKGMLRLYPRLPAQARLLISVGVHGDETAPLTILAPVLDAILRAPQALSVDLLLVIGNPAALAAGKRFVDVDLNRLFHFPSDSKKLFQGTSVEASRATAIMPISTDFLSVVDVPKWHLDFHSTIRPSLHPCFAIVPTKNSGKGHQLLTTWLGQAGMDAIVYNDLPAATFSAFTARHCGAFSCTVELGQVGRLAAHEVTTFLLMQQAVSCLLRNPLPAMAEDSTNEKRIPTTHPPRYRVVQEIIKHQDDFKLKLPSDACNFTAVPAGAAIAQEGQTLVHAGPEAEYALFPNPGVQLGQRAVLMLAAHKPDVDSSQDC